jgi:O-antigen ligase
MGFKVFFAAAALSLPWLIGAAPGPVAQMGAWAAAVAALAVVMVVMVLAGQACGRSARAWPLSLALAAVASCVVALIQYAGWAHFFSPWVAQAQPGEMLGNLRQRNQLASLMALGFLALMALMLLWTRWVRQASWTAQAGRRGALVWLCGLAALLAGCSALSGSRTGLLQWLAVLGLGWVWQRQADAASGAAWRWLLGAAAAGYVLGMLGAPLLADALGHANAGLLGRADDANALSRVALWSNVLELIAREPLLGHGWRSLAYLHYSSEFSGERFMEMLDNAHNLPLHLAVELGLPVALGFCAFVGWLVCQAKPWAETRPDRQLAWGALLVIGIHSLLEYPLWYGPFFMTASISVAILCADTWRKWLAGVTLFKQSAIHLGVKALALLLLATTMFLAFDYHRVSQIYLQADERSSWYAADPLGAAKQSVFFQNHAKFAELQITPLSRESAPRILELSSELVQWSPEPRIIEKLIESSVMLGLDDVAAFHLTCFARAYPVAHAAWKSRVS